MLGQVTPVHHRAEAQLAHRVRTSGRENCPQRLHGQGQQRLGFSRIDFQLAEYLGSDFLRILRIDRPHTRSALDNRLMEQAAGRRHRQQRRDLRASTGLAENRDIVGIATEFGDVARDPSQGLHEVQHPRVAGIREALLRTRSGKMQIAEQVEPVIERDDDDIALVA